MCHNARLIFVPLPEKGFHNIGQAGLKLLTSGDPSASASQRTGITGMSHHASLPFSVSRGLFTDYMCGKGGFESTGMNARDLLSGGRGDSEG